MDDERQRDERRRQPQAGDHERHAGDPVREPPEHGLPDEAGGRPCGDNKTEGRKVDALLRVENRQHREQRAEPRPGDGLGPEEWQDRPPASEPAGSSDGDVG